MSEETYTFEKARVRLEEIATQVRRKDVSLEKSLDLLEEGVRLANLCTERIDHTQWRAAVAEMEAEGDAVNPAAASAAVAAADRATEAVVEAPVSGGPDAGEPSAGENDEDGDTAGAVEACEIPPAGADAEGDVPGEDAHAAATEAAGEGEPDPEA